MLLSTTSSDKTVFFTIPKCCKTQELIAAVAFFDTPFVLLTNAKAESFILICHGYLSTLLLQPGIVSSVVLINNIPNVKTIEHKYI